MSFDDLKLRTKITIPLALMGFTILAMIAFSGLKLDSLGSTTTDLVQRRSQGGQWVARARSGVLSMGYDLLATLAFDNDAPEGKAAGAGFPDSIKNVTAALDKAAKLLPERADDIGELKTRFDQIAKAAQSPFKIGLDAPALTVGSKLKPGEIDELADGAKQIGALDAQFRTLDDDLRKLVMDLLGEDYMSAVDLQSQSTSALWTLAIVGVGAALLAGAVALWIASAKIANPLRRLGGAMATLASGDTGVEIEGARRADEVGEMSRAVEVFKRNALDRERLEAEAAAERARAEREREAAAAERAKAAAELGEAVRRLGSGLKELADGNLQAKLNDGFTSAYVQLRDDFNEAIDKLRATFVTVIGSTGAIETSAREVKGAADDLSQRTEAQASSLEETSASLTEVTAAVQKSAEGTRHAREVAAAADKDAKDSANVVNRAVEAMSAIAKSSQEIGKIIGVIDEIAFQTNLLALNAGVEAARAGDAGKGFAVVASEVRALAQRSAEAAKEIKSLISTSDTQVLAGVDLVAETGRSLQRIVAKVAQINSVVADIATGAQEQSSALQQINTAIEQMSSATQANAAMVEESTAAGHALSEQSSKLASLIGQFRVGEDRSRREATRAGVSRARAA